MKLSIIIPAYNEEKYIKDVIQRIKDVPLPFGLDKEIIIVDDKSTDRTAEILRGYSLDSEIKLVFHKKNRGKSDALKKGIDKSLGEIILIQDADLEYSPKDYPELVRPIIEKGVDVVYGSRFKGSIKNMAFLNRVANIISNLTLNLFFGTRITDINTCYKAFRKEVLDSVSLESSNFMFETEVTAKILKKGYKILEVPISYTARTREEGKKMNLPQAVQMYWGIIKYRFKQ